MVSPCTPVGNAGFGSAGRFVDVPAGVDQTRVAVNVGASVGLTRAPAPGMLDRGAGVVVDVASAA
ncbi:hypothetical protein GCM10022243_01530 [Saccharothrix violaceirubra]